MINPLPILLALFLLIPVTEIYVLIQVGGVIGALPTVLLVVLTAVIGAVLLRAQGFSTLQRVQASMAQGRLPAVELMEGVVLLLCGALLLTPGFVTDTLGFLGLVPALRRRAVEAVLKRGFMVSAGPAPGPRQGPATIEGECRREDD